MKDEMGMDYTPVFADAAGPSVRISPEVINNLGVRTEAALAGRLAAPRRHGRLRELRRAQRAAGAGRGRKAGSRA